MKKIRVRKPETNQLYTIAFPEQAYEEFSRSNVGEVKLLQKILKAVADDKREGDRFETLVFFHEISFIQAEKFRFHILAFERIILQEPDENEIKCPECGAEKGYSVRFDAYFCPQCNEWLEEKCGDPYCDYCANRPNRPLNQQKKCHEAF
ncbi:hypothetical protein CULT_2070011 [[Clostridium] ultunense Esp]|nr:hypothetical protein CULT_2070011 [[Clostridium] ultunense Esp]